MTVLTPQLMSVDNIWLWAHNSGEAYQMIVVIPVVFPIRCSVFAVSHCSWEELWDGEELATLRPYQVKKNRDGEEEVSYKLIYRSPYKFWITEYFKTLFILDCVIQIRVDLYDTKTENLFIFCCSVKEKKKKLH